MRLTADQPELTLLPLPAFSDNYIWLLHDGRQAWAVDPGDARPVLATLQELGLSLQAILLTHHHADHTGGVPELRQATGAAVYGPAGEKMPEPVQRVAQGDRIDLLGQSFEVLDVPGHTAGHVAYFGAGTTGSSPLLFCGDTLFSGGCGRLFEGTPAQMLASLDKLARLPDATKVCCAHEYTLSNLRFALAVEPDNARLAAYAQTCQALRDQGQPTLPALLGEELAINPFLRSRTPTVRAAVTRHAGGAGLDDAQAFAQLREWKNQFK